jgi:hypothetical protein
MKFIRSILVLACALGVSSLAWAAPQSTGHAHSTHATTPAPAPSQRWLPDAPLREGMRRARAAVDGLHAGETGHMSAQAIADHASAVEAAVVYMFAHCKLAPEPDNALHGILVPLLDAAQRLKKDPRRIEAVVEMRAAIERYPQYFNDPGWDQPAGG